MDKERFDYARVLIATSSFEIINCTEELMIDGDLVKVKIIEEWGFNIGDDACLYEEDEDGTDTQPEKEEGRVDPEIDVNTDILVEKIVKDLVDSEWHVKSNADVEFLEVTDSDVEPRTSSHSKQKSEGEFPMDIAATSVLSAPLVTHHVECASSNNDADEQGPVVNLEAHMEVRGVDSDGLVAEQRDVTMPDSHSKRRRTRTDSCPPRVDRSIVSGSWSLEWLSDQHHSEAGVVSSSRKILKKEVRNKANGVRADVSMQKRKKVDGILRHSVLSLKKVARLPIKDRQTVMHILKKYRRKFQGSPKLKKAVTMTSKEVFVDTSSSNSGTNDWKHWMVMHGSEKVVREDVRSIGETIGVHLSDSHNRFVVLARMENGKKKGLVEGA